jgi:hypothetical protein
VVVGNFALMTKILVQENSNEPLGFHLLYPAARERLHCARRKQSVGAV